MSMRRRMWMALVLAWLGGCGAKVVVDAVDAGPDSAHDECADLPNGWSCDEPMQGACLDGVCVPGE